MLSVPLSAKRIDGAKHLANCSLVGVLRLKDVSLSEQASQVLQRMPSLLHGACNGCRSLAIGCLFCLKMCSAPLESLQLLDLGRLGLQQVESDTFAGLSNLRILSLSQNHLKVLPEDLLRHMPALEQLLLGGKSDDYGNRIVDGNELSVLSQELLQHSPRLQVLDLSENRLTSLPNGIFDKTPLLQAGTLNLGWEQSSKVAC